MVHHERVVGKELHPYISGVNTKYCNRVIMGVISIIACCHIVSFVPLFGLSHSSSYIRLICKLVGQPFTKHQKSKMLSMQ